MVCGAQGVPSSEHTPAFQSYSRQDPAVTTRAPPASRKAVTRSRLARTQSKFSGAAAHLPGAMYHARWSRWLARLSSTDAPDVGRVEQIGLHAIERPACRRVCSASGPRTTSHPRSTSARQGHAADASGCARDQNATSQESPTAWSLAEITVGVIGHSMPIAGSFQRSPRSDSGWYAIVTG